MFSSIFAKKGTKVADNCVVAARIKRTDEQKWQSTRSCLGGIPKLSRREWPIRMHCIAQVDLAEVSALKVDPQFPSEGGLAFFANTGSFSGSPHTGAVCAVSAEQLGSHETDTYLAPLYGEDWDYYSPSMGACGPSDAPKFFPRWPLEFVGAHQSATSNDLFDPPLDEIFGPISNSIHLPLKGLVAGVDREGRFVPHEDASPFPVRAAQMILNQSVRIAGKFLASGEAGRSDPATVRLNQMRNNIAFVEPILTILEKWQETFKELDPDDPLGRPIGDEFVHDVAELVAIFKERKERLGIGAGTTMTGGAALESYFGMYCGRRQSYESIPEKIRVYIEHERMRTAYSVEMTHQIGGYGANVQESEMAARGMILLLQLATDEAVGFMWGDVGVIQYWIDPADLAERNWGKVEFLMHGH